MAFSKHWNPPTQARRGGVAEAVAEDHYSRRPRGDSKAVAELCSRSIKCRKESEIRACGTAAGTASFRTALESRAYAQAAPRAAPSSSKPSGRAGRAASSGKR